MGKDIRFEDWAVELGLTNAALSKLLKKGLSIEVIAKMRNQPMKGMPIL
jgi:hypothetical protein